MDKNAVIGELLYILANYEKGRIKSKGLWRKKYKNSIKKSMDIIQIMISLLQSSEGISIDRISPVVDYLKEKADIIFPVNCDELLKWQKDNYILVSDISSEGKYFNVNKLMREIADEIMFLLNKRETKYKLKISYLLFAFHNLPRVYLNTELDTLCNINIQPISVKDAISYATSYLVLKNSL